MKTYKNKNGFILIEIVITVMLIGVIGSFVSFFLYTGVKGYFTTKQATEGALKGQIAMDRISLELRNVNSVSAASTDSITYKSDDFGNSRRQIYYDSDTNIIYLSIDSEDDGNFVDNPLLDSIENFTLSWTADDLDGDFLDKLSGINITFTSQDIGSGFNVQIFPRNLILPPS